jgi:NitT/TauT family transport system ATP-binding protein
MSTSSSAAGQAIETGQITCREVALTFRSRRGQSKAVLSGVDLTVEPGQFISLLGGSGVGKTSLLRILGGLQKADEGSDVRYDGVPIAGPPPGVVTVFQDYAASLLPWRTVAGNVALGIEDSVPKAERAERVAGALEMVGLTASSDAHPWQISGGMQQRVQIARALVTRPSALMMDEPFGALDAMTKESLQDALLRIHHETQTTIVFVTHDLEEAVYLSDRVVVLVGAPGGIAADIRIDLARPRNQVTTKEAPEYLRLRRDVYDLIRSGHGR